MASLFDRRPLRSVAMLAHRLARAARSPRKDIAGCSTFLCNRTTRRQNSLCRYGYPARRRVGLPQASLHPAGVVAPKEKRQRLARMPGSRPPTCGRPLEIPTYRSQAVIRNHCHHTRRRRSSDRLNRLVRSPQSTANFAAIRGTLQARFGLSEPLYAYFRQRWLQTS